MEKTDRRKRLRVPGCCLVFVVLVAILATGIVFFVAGGKMRVKSELDDIRARGEPVRYADLEPPDVPDSDNAFLYYERAGGMLAQMPVPLLDATVRVSKTPMGQWSKGDVALLRAYVKQDAAALAITHQGTLCKGFKSRVNWNSDVSAFFPLFAKLRELTRQLSYKAQIDLCDGRIDEATDTCGDMFRLSDHASSGATLITYLVSTACRGITYGLLEQIVVTASDE